MASLAALAKPTTSIRATAGTQGGTTASGAVSLLGNIADGFASLNEEASKKAASSTGSGSSHPTTHADTITKIALRSATLALGPPIAGTTTTIAAKTAYASLAAS